MINLKKRKRVLLTMVICISFLLLFSQAAVAAGSVKLSASSESGLTDKQVVVKVNITNAKDTEGGQFELTFDPDIVEPVSIAKGKFVADADSHMFDANLKLADNKLIVIWVTPKADTADSGEVCAITFKMLDDGESFLTFGEVVVAPAEAEVAATHTAGKITVVDPADAKKAAIDAAIAAIAALPAPADIELTDKAAVEAARALVKFAKDDHGAVDADITNLAKLVDAEKMILKLEAIKAACDAVMALPDLNKLTLDDKPAVVAARALVNKAKADHGAVDADFVCLPKLTAAENRIKELEGLQPTPSTGGMHYQLLSGLLIFGGGTLALIKRRNRVTR